jgi:hypothetical protein
VPSQVDDEVAKWRGWIDGPISIDVLAMHRKRMIWREVREILGANPAVGQTPSAFWDFYESNYATSQAIAVRRQADRPRRGPPVRSLAVLIGEMRDSAERLTRDYYVGLLGDQLDDDRMVERAHHGFDMLAGPGDHLDPEISKADLASLRSDAARVGRYVNEHLAHDAAEPTEPELPTLADLHAAINSVGEMFKKYAVTLTGGIWLSLEPAIQYDWKAIFRAPWIA